MSRHISQSKKALEAAEKRKRMSSVLGGGGRLGGKSNTSGKSPRELAAEAAEKRAQDEKTCGSLHDDEIQKEVSKVAESDVIEVIDVDEDSVVTTQNKKRQRSPSASVEVPYKRRTEPASKRTEAAESPSEGGISCRVKPRYLDLHDMYFDQ